MNSLLICVHHSIELIPLYFYRNCHNYFFYRLFFFLPIHRVIARFSLVHTLYVYYIQCKRVMKLMYDRKCRKNITTRGNVVISFCISNLYLLGWREQITLIFLYFYLFIFFFLHAHGQWKITSQSIFIRL